MALKATLKETSFSVGDTLEVHQKIKEGDKTRTQIFKGVVISIKGHGENKSFMVRRIGAGAIGIERIWPLNSPWISKVKVVKTGKVKRAKLYYLRKRAGKGAMRVKTAAKKVEEKKEKVKSKPKKPRQTSRKASRKTAPKSS